MPRLDRRDTTAHTPKNSYRHSVHYDDRGRYWVHWSIHRRVHLRLGPGGCRARVEWRRHHYRREVGPAEAQFLAREWGVPFPGLPKRMQGWG